jgi:hypothetical protein
MVKSYFLVGGESRKLGSIYDVKKQYQYIGKLSRDVFIYDHRERRGAETLAKKLMYSLFVLPGGTYYVKKGTKKSLLDYLVLIGEYRKGEGLHRKKVPRSLYRLTKAIDLLVEKK